MQAEIEKLKQEIKELEKKKQELEEERKTIAKKCHNACLLIEVMFGRLTFEEYYRRIGLG